MIELERYQNVAISAKYVSMLSGICWTQAQIRVKIDIVSHLSLTGLQFIFSFFLHLIEGHKKVNERRRRRRRNNCVIYKIQIDNIDILMKSNNCVVLINLVHLSHSSQNERKNTHSHKIVYFKQNVECYTFRFLYNHFIKL